MKWQCGYEIGHWLAFFPIHTIIIYLPLSYQPQGPTFALFSHLFIYLFVYYSSTVRLHYFNNVFLFHLSIKTQNLTEKRQGSCL